MQPCLARLIHVWYMCARSCWAQPRQAPRSLGPSCSLLAGTNLLSTTARTVARRAQRRSCRPRRSFTTGPHMHSRLQCSRLHILCKHRPKWQQRCDARRVCRPAGGRTCVCAACHANHPGIARKVATLRIAGLPRCKPRLLPLMLLYCFRCFWLVCDAAATHPGADVHGGGRASAGPPPRAPCPALPPDRRLGTPAAGGGGGEVALSHIRYVARLCWPSITLPRCPACAARS